MDKLGRDKGLVRYDSLRGLGGNERPWFRPRIAFYGVMGAIGLVVAVAAARSRQGFEVNVLRQRGAPFVVDQAGVRNAFELHLVNKFSETDTFHIEVQAMPNAEIVLPRADVPVPSLRDASMPLFVTIPRSDVVPGMQVRAVVTSARGESKTVTAPFLGPPSGGTR
jgi:polyferredoxin